MNGADRGEVTVSDDGVTVRKTVNVDQFEDPTVVMGLQSDRDDPVRLRVIERTPATWSLDAIGFDPSYGAEHWSLEGDSLVFERVLDPGERYTTLYSLRDEAEIGNPLSYEPQFELVSESVAADRTPDEDGPNGLDDLVSESDNDPIRDVIAGDRDDLPGVGADAETETDLGGEAAGEGDPLEEQDVGAALSDDAADAGAGEPATASGDDAESAVEPESEPEPATAEPADTESKSAAGDGGTEPETETEPEPETQGPEEDDAGEDSTEGDREQRAVPAGGVGRVLAEELRQDQLSDDDRELLREELGVARGSTEARIQHLQNEVSDLAAYTEALEEFIDEEGDAQQLLDDIDGRLAGIEDRMDDVEEQVAEVEDLVADFDDVVADLSDRMSEFDDRMSEFDDEVVEVRDELFGLQTDVSDNVDDIERLEDRVEEIRDDVEEIEQFRDRLTSTLRNLTGGFEPED